MVCLIVLDGWGVNPRTEGNAIALANTRNMDRLAAEYPSTTLACAGEAVGLPSCQMGNSEVGHLNIGAGRIVYQDYSRINAAIGDGSFFKNPALLGAIEDAKKHRSRLHLMGLLSDGGVHSHDTHLYALLQLAKEHRVEAVFLHLFLDGRDVPPQSALDYIEKLKNKMAEIGVGEIATISGRYYAMDRDRRWERTKQAYDALVYGQGVTAETPEQAIEQSYTAGVADEFVKPTVIGSRVKGQGSGVIEDNDSVIFFNFRPDRARQLTRAFTQPDFDAFDRGEHPPVVHFVCMTEYDVRFKVPVAFAQPEIKNTLAHVLAERGLPQLHIAETEKYAHVTFFLNGGVEEPEKGEERILIPSPKVATYDLKPEMSAYEVTDRVIQEIDAEKFDAIFMNYANPDMVGHTAIRKAVVSAIEVVDQCVGQVVEAVRAHKGIAIVTGDHGNAEQIEDYKTGKPHTAHTTSRVPFILVADKHLSLRQDGMLADIAPTMLDLMRISKPAEMTGKSLLC